MADYFTQGANDSQRGQFYAYSLPHGKMPNSETRMTYRAGFVSNRAARGKENLPAAIGELHGHYIWIVAVNSTGNPIYQITRGGEPKGGAGYNNLHAMLNLKGLRFEYY